MWILCIIYIQKRISFIGLSSPAQIRDVCKNTFMYAKKEQKCNMNSLSDKITSITTRQRWEEYVLEEFLTNLSPWGRKLNVLFYMLIKVKLAKDWNNVFVILWDNTFRFSWVFRNSLKIIIGPLNDKLFCNQIFLTNLSTKYANLTLNNRLYVFLQNTTRIHYNVSKMKMCNKPCFS